MEVVPEALVAQLSAKGRLVAVHIEGGFGRAVRGVVAGGALVLAPEFDCNAPVLPAFRRAPAFAF